MTRSPQIRLRPGGSRTHSLRNWRRMASRKRREIRTLLSLFTPAQNQRRKFKARAALVLVLDQALVLALGTGGDSVGATASQGAGVGVGVMGLISGPQITPKAV